MNGKPGKSQPSKQFGVPPKGGALLSAQPIRLRAWFSI
uniref:Uncharacterized protein n=1 Tax=Agrobacterium tumefaciens TaxID=358 RepID=A0A2P0QJK7_AGRTU|nr:hypothetical protein AgrTiChry5_37 [Agrobacterium tumefaciens]